MWSNDVGDEGAAYIADMLCQNKTLRNLCITGCNLGVKAFIHISRGLAQNNTLHRIDLNCSEQTAEYSEQVGNEHVRMLCPGLVANRGLQVLDLKGTQITNSGLRAIELALRTNYHLRSIKLNQPFFEEYIETGTGSTWWKICCWMHLNELNRQILLLPDEDVDTSKWHEVLTNCHETGDTNAIFYFLRSKPELCEMFY